jgi:tetratricopeptide (TPR) repeat protein
LRIAAISGFFAHKSEDSERLIKKSIEIAQTPAQRVQGYIYLGVIATENGDFTQSKQHFEQALLTTSGIKEPQQRIYFAAVTNGYYARLQALMGNHKKAITLYTLAIEQANRAGIKQKLALSQLNQGLAEAYLAQGDKVQSAQTAKIATKLAKEALKLCETNNTALSFAVNRRAALRCD